MSRSSVTMDSSVKVSPDGRRIAFVAETADGRQFIWIRAVEGLAAEPLSGTENGVAPFWSPDGHYLAFFADGKLKKMEVSGGPPQVLCDTTGGLGGTWNSEGTIVFAAGSAPVLYRVPDRGGPPTAITTLDATRQEIGHLWPSFLPDGRHFLYLSNAPLRTNRSMLIGSLDSASVTRLPSVHSRAEYAPPGHLLFAIDTTLMAQAFDPDDFVLTGQPVRVAQRVRVTDQAGYSIFSVSTNGVLAYQVGDVGFGTQLVWFDRTGKRIAALAPPAEYSNPSLSPDGTRVAVGVLDPQTMTRDLWVFDVTRGTASRVTFDASDDLNPAWSPDGTRLVFTSDRKGQRDIYQKSVSGIGSDELVFESPEQKSVNDWSADGRYLLYDSGALAGATAVSISALPLFGDRRPSPLVRGTFSVMAPRLSPDGQWIAYGSTESGRPEVYVQPFPELTGKWQISGKGGTEPYWRGDGEELFYIENDTIMAVSVTAALRNFSAGIPRPLFAAPLRAGILRNRYVVSPDGQRFLINVTTENPASSLIPVVLNWTAELKK